MSRAAAMSLVLAFTAGVVALALVAASDRRDLAFTLGVEGSERVPVPPGAEACQLGVDAPEDFDAVRLRAGTFKRSGPSLAVRVVAEAGPTPLGAGRLPGGYGDNSEERVAVGRVEAAERRIAVCVRNDGPGRVALFGGSRYQSRSRATVAGRPAGADLQLVFERLRERSVLAALPDAFARGSRFRSGVVGPWTFWLLLGAAALGAPMLMAWAVSRAADEGTMRDTLS